MKIEVVTIDENEDGSADVVFNMDEESISALLRLGIITALRNGIEEAEKYKVEKEQE